MRLSAAAILLLALAFSNSAQASWIKAPTLFGPAVEKADAAAGAHQRAARRATRNLFRQYQVASTSRSCLTPATRAVLDRLEARFGRVQIVSTCRPGATIAGTSRPSYHRYGMAVDFHPPKGRKSDVVRFLYAQGTLVMTYRGMTHVHFNLGQGARIACGGCGRRHAVSARKVKRDTAVAEAPWSPPPAF